MPIDGRARGAAAIVRYAAFTRSPAGGNPAGVVLDASALSDRDRLAIARDLGYSETAFLSRLHSGVTGEYDVRYFSPQAEVPFCGHATIAAAVALADRDGTGHLVFHIRAGTVPVTTQQDASGAITASLTSVTPSVQDVPAADVDAALAALGWRRGELDASLPPKIAYAGARHLILAAASRERLARLDYDFEALRTFMIGWDLTTIDLVFDAGDRLYHARNPFPVGGVYEDPATGAAAAAFGAYLRELGRVAAPAQVTVRQGDDMGRPSRIIIDVPRGDGPITVTGGAVPIRG
ncbi:MAG TPA: PhzF family phenazine biosynthesis isomerase [Streptosporangiaceae bacterium]